jgi:hypothetical protein
MTFHKCSIPAGLALSRVGVERRIRDASGPPPLSPRGYPGPLLPDSDGDAWIGDHEAELVVNENGPEIERRRHVGVARMLAVVR